ncbi:MAG: hypothetical protein JJU34_14055 [Lunatimonas sp.]|uniref:hypothetical protein n=1 Tax=Lunatimonas sp. TaxID=2060141 RepID=UPI00263B34B5|nr:hypothetical protein [Lunatimonas sp.]MCC5938397.1 hypothetical protein [Lunatimonas sp.]
MKKIVSRYATPANLVLLVILVVVNNLALIWFFRNFPEPILDTYLFYTAEEAYAIIEAYGAYYRAMYIRGTLLLDFMYPVWYTLMLSFGIYRASGQAGWALFPLWILPLDYVENGTLIYLLTQYPTEHLFLASAVGFITCAKWAMVLTSVLFILRALLMRYIIKKPKQS